MIKDGDSYKAFKDYYYQNCQNGIEPIVKSIFRYSKHYQKFVNARHTANAVEDMLCNNHETGLLTMTPVILKILDLRQENSLSDQEVSRMLMYMYSYAMRRTICKVPTNSLNGAFLTLLKDVYQNKSAESFEAVITSNSETPLTYAQRFPTDNEVVEYLKTNRLYKTGIDRIVLDKIEEFLNKDYTHNDRHSIEHIMPETIESHESLYDREDLSNEEKEKKDWAADLGEDWKDVYEKYTHTIGNLTLTGYNSEYQNYRFKYKLTMQKTAEDGKRYGYRYSPIHLTTSIADKEKWGASEIIERSKKLADIINQIWPYPKAKK